MKILMVVVILLVMCVSGTVDVVAQKIESVNPISERTGDTEFRNADAFSDGNGTWLVWDMVAQRQNVGFNVYRVTRDSREQANPHMIGGGALQSTDEIFNGGNYSFFDRKGGINAIYLIEGVDLNGRSTKSELVFTRFVNDLTPYARRSSQELQTDRAGSEPIIEKNVPVVPGEMEKALTGVYLPPDIAKQRLIAGQPGVKIGTKREGIYRVSRAELLASGFDVSGSPENWQLFKDGNEQAMIVGENGTFIEFYGNGIDTIDSGQQIYFLINGSRAGKRIAQSYQRGIAGQVIGRSYEQAFSRVERILYFGNLRNGDANNFFSDRLVNTTGATISFNLDGIDLNRPKVSVTVKVQGFTLVPHNTEVSLNGERLGNITGSNHALMTGIFEIPTSILVEGNNTLLLKAQAGSGDISLYDSVKVNYARLYKAKQNALSFYTNPYRRSVLNGFTSANIRVFDITYPDSPTVISNLPITEDSGDFSVILPSNRPKLMFAAEDSAVLNADSIAINTPSTLATANHQGNIIIISNKDWLTEAETWANYRRNEGYSVEVVRVDDIFDEFNYGITSAGSIRTFLQYAKNNWQTPPSYVLILGDATYDPRNYSGFGDFNFVPVKMIDTVYEETGSDEAMADFDDDGLAEIAIGRVPAQTAANVTQNLNKVITFEQTSGLGFSRGALYISDLPQGYDFEAMSQRLANQLPAGTPIQMINRGDTNSRQTVLSALDNGKYLVNYAGHGSTGLWAVSSFYGLSDPLTMANGNDLTVLTLLTCLNGYFLRPDSTSLSENFLVAPNGGAVAVWASTGKTTPDIQEILATRFYQQISAGNMPRIGDLIRDSKQAVVAGRDVRLSWALLGDPVLKLR